MTHGIECPLVQWQDGVGGEGEVQVLEGAREVFIMRTGEFCSGYFVLIWYVPNVVILATSSSTVPFGCHCQLPGILAILRVVRESPQNEVGLGEIGTGNNSNVKKYIMHLSRGGSLARSD